jgi:hypothetical protein
MGRGPFIAVLCAAVAMLASSCTGAATTVSSAAKTHHPSTVRPASAPRLTITPANGDTVDPAPGITVTASGGMITQVEVRTDGDPVTGMLNAARTVWRSDWALDVAQSYTVTATATGPGGTVTRTVSFRTLVPAQTFSNVR